MPVILVVCTANVCRSPLAAAILSAELRASFPETLTVLSAGTAGAGDEELCPTAARQLALKGIGTVYAERSRAGRLDTGLVETADIILTTDVVQRGVVAQLSAPARSRTFTMREAAYLLNGAARQRAGRPDPVDFSEAVGRINGLRATIITPGSVRGGRLGAVGRRRNPLDIGDGHMKGPKAHSDVVHAVTAATEELARLLREYSPVPA